MEKVSPFLRICEMSNIVHDAIMEKDVARARSALKTLCFSDEAYAETPLNDMLRLLRTHIKSLRLLLESLSLLERDSTNDVRELLFLNLCESVVCVCSMIRKFNPLQR